MRIYFLASPLPRWGEGQGEGEGSRFFPLLFACVFAFGVSLAEFRIEDRSRDTPRVTTEPATLEMEKECARLEADLAQVPDDRPLADQVGKTKRELHRRHLRTAKSLEKDGYLLAAIGIYQRALIYDPKSREAARRMEGAKVRLARIDRWRAEQFYQRGLKAYLSGNREYAEDSWKSALQIDPGMEEAQAALEQLNAEADLQGPGEPGAAGAGSLSVPEVAMDNDVRGMLWNQNYRNAEEFIRQGRYEDAEKAFEKALVHQPNDADTKEQLANVRKVLEKKRRKSSMEFYWLGVRAVQSLDYRKAHRHLKQAVENDPENREARSLLKDLVKKHPEVLHPQERGKTDLNDIIKENSGGW